MAPPRGRRTRRSSSELVDILADASRGIVRDAARAAIPEDGLYDSADWMLDRPGVVYKRGGSSYFGPDWGLAGTHYAAAVAYAEFVGGPHVVGISEHGHVVLVTSGAASDKGTLSPANPGIDTPKLRNDKLIIIPATHAADGAVHKYTAAAGGTLATLGGSPPEARFGAVYKTRLVLGGNDTNRNYSYFSPTPDIESTWDTTNAWVAHDLAVTGYAALQNLLLVFGEGRMERIVGSTPPPLTDMDRSVIANIGCTDARSIAIYEDSAIFANTRGVYVSNGGKPWSLTEEGGIASYWQTLFSGYDRTTWTIAGGVHRSFYFVNILDNNGALVAGFMCNVPRRAWKRYTNNRGLMFAPAVGSSDELYVADRAAERLIALSGYFVPVAGNKNDADGTAVTGFLESRLFGRGVGLKHFRDGRITYDMRDAASDNPTLAVTVADGLEAPTFTALAESPLGETSNAVRTPGLTFARESQGVTVRLQQSGASAKTELYALEVETRPLALTAIGPTA